MTGPDAAHVDRILLDTGCPKCGSVVSVRALRLGCYTCGWWDQPPTLPAALRRRKRVEILLRAHGLTGTGATE